MANRIAIIADDLTGAADSVVPFLKNGWRCGLDWQFDDQTPMDLDAIALDTETRDLHYGLGDRVANRVRSAADHAIASGFSIVYKKIDSTLRGNLSPELTALREALPGRVAVICPAFPSNGRTVVGGDLLVYGKKLQDSDFASRSKGRSGLITSSVRSAFFGKDPSETDLLRTALSKAWDHSQEIRIDTVRSGQESLHLAVNQAVHSGVNSLFIDAETDSDLATIAEIVVQRPEAYLPVGSAGLSAAIAHVLREDGRRDRPVDDENKATAGRAACAEGHLIVIGSRHAASRLQANSLQTAGVSIHTNVGAALRALREGQSAAMVASPVADAPPEDVAKRWREGGLEWSQSRPIVGLVVSGGATAIEMLRALRPTHWIAVVGEFEPGIVLTEARRRSHVSAELPPRFSVSLKAGGFGDGETLVRLMRLIPDYCHYLADAKINGC